MNSLSVLIYFAGVAPAISEAIGGILVVGGIALVIWWVVIFAHNDGCFTSEEWSYSCVKRASIGYAIALCVLLPLRAFIPSEKTLYMIAGSEIGEVIVKDEATKEVVGQMKDTVIAKLKAMSREADSTFVEEKK